MDPEADNITRRCFPGCLDLNSLQTCVGVSGKTKWLVLNTTSTKNSSMHFSERLNRDERKKPALGRRSASPRPAPDIPEARGGSREILLATRPWRQRRVGEASERACGRAKLRKKPLSVNHSRNSPLHQHHPIPSHAHPQPAASARAVTSPRGSPKAPRPGRGAL